MKKAREIFNATIKEFLPPEGFNDESRVTIENILGLQESLDDGDWDEEFSDLMILFDEYICWMYSICLYTQFVLLKEKKSEKERKNVIFMLHLVGAICSFGLSVRALIFSGFDVSAKQITRSIGEYIDTFILSSFDESVVSDFLGTDNPEAANKFWHKYLSKGKSKNILIKEVFGGKVPKGYL